MIRRQRPKKKKSIIEKQQRYFTCGPSVCLILIGCVLALISISLVAVDIAPGRTPKEAINAQSQPHNQVLPSTSPSPQQNTTILASDTSSVKEETKKLASAENVTVVLAHANSIGDTASTKFNRTIPVPTSLFPSTRPGLKATEVSSGQGINNQSDKLSPLKPWKKKKGAIDLHFIHIPKCGGTSMTAILRQVLCQIDPERNIDCCTNPGFCDWHAFRRCEAIRGCTNHIPNRPWIFRPQPTITILREPVSRLLSAWFYRGHSPNLDFFQVRPYFKEIEQGKRPKVIFQEYIEMNEYQNIQTRMLGADSFPYRDINITTAVYNKAVEALNGIFFVGIQEAYDISIQIMLRELHVPVQVDIKKERDQQSSKSISKQKHAIKTNNTLLARVRVVNSYDMKLYHLGLVRFCTTAKKYPDLYEKLKKSGAGITSKTSTSTIDCEKILL